ncbi:MAG: hypothetical protein RI962_1792, partial [Pseudomonadota bacterium]
MPTARKRPIRRASRMPPMLLSPGHHLNPLRRHLTMSLDPDQLRSRVVMLEI